MMITMYYFENTQGSSVVSFFGYFSIPPSTNTNFDKICFLCSIFFTFRYPQFTTLIGRQDFFFKAVKFKISYNLIFNVPEKYRVQLQKYPYRVQNKIRYP
uniref:Uncharacterized protein n=1 Tax=Cacopsylla melanoneura TaxID=428564 RepID=A0A8D8QSM4_9HEMI